MAGAAVSLLGRLADRVLGTPIPAAELPFPVPPGVTVRRGALVPRVAGWFMGRTRAPAGAVTLGRTIVWNPRLPLSEDVLVHELVHVEQWKDPLFAVKYAAAWARYGYRRNPYEKEAYARQREHAASGNPHPRGSP